MKKALLWATLFVCLIAWADDTLIYAPNLPGYVTGTNLGGGHIGLDINGQIVIPSSAPLPVSIISPNPVPVILVSPSPLPVTIIGPSPLPIQGSVSISGPSPLPVSGTVTISGTPSFILASPSPLPVTIVAPSPLPISGTVSVTNIPTVSISPVPSPSPIFVNTINANATLSARQSVTGTETSLAAPSNSVGVLVECESGNSDNLRWGFSNSSTAILSTTLGILCEPGRDSGWVTIGAGSYLHMIAVTTASSDYIDVQWVLYK